MSDQSSSRLSLAYTSRVYQYDQHTVEKYLETRSQEISPECVTRKIASTSAKALAMVKERKADIAIVPFFYSSAGYVFETLREMVFLFDVVATDIIKYTPTYDLVTIADAGNARLLKTNQLPDVKTLYASTDALKNCPVLCKQFADIGASIVTVNSDDDALAALRRNGAGKSADEAFPYGAITNSSAIRDNTHFSVLKSAVQDKHNAVAYYLCVKNVKDETAFYDKFKTTDASTRYFSRRMKGMIKEAEERSDKTPIAGFNVLTQFSRSGDAAGIGEIESYLRNFGVRYNTFQYPQDHQTDTPAPVILDVEFEAHDFRYDPRRRLRGTVANGALKMSLSRWKSRKPLILGSMPLTTFRLSKPSARRWWREGADNAAGAFAKTVFIRFSRVLFYVFCAAVAAYALIALFGMI